MPFASNLLLLSLLALAPDSSAGPLRDRSGPTLTLSQALEVAGDRQPQLRAARAHERAAQARIVVNRSGFLPHIDGSMQYQRSTKNFLLMPSFASSAFSTLLHPQGTGQQAGSNGLSLSNDTVNFLQAGANLTWMLYDFGQTLGQYRQAKSEANRALRETRRLAQQLYTRVRVAFFRTVAADAVVEVAERTVANQCRHHDDVETFVNAGTRPKIDLHSARLNVQSAKLTRLQAAHETRLARIELNRAMGRESWETISSVAPEPDSDATGDTQTAESESSLSELLREAEDGRDELAALDADLAGAHAAQAIAQSGYFPRLTGLLNFASTRVENLPWTYNWYAGVGLTWNLFAGAQTYGQQAEAKSNVRALTARRLDLLQSVHAEVTQRFLEVAEGQERLALTARAAEIAAERLALAEDRYRADLSSMLELEDAQVAQANAEVDRVKAGCQLAIARVQLRDAAGKTTL